jgi:hypothetical protein
MVSTPEAWRATHLYPFGMIQHVWSLTFVLHIHSYPDLCYFITTNLIKIDIMYRVFQLLHIVNLTNQEITICCRIRGSVTDSTKSCNRIVSWAISKYVMSLRLNISENSVIERHGRVVKTPTSYSGGPGFDSRTRRPDILIEVFRAFPQSLQANVGIVP